VHLKDFLTADEVRVRHNDLTVEAAGAQQRGVQNVRAVRRGDQDDAFVRLETVHLDEKLVERLLALVIAAAKTCAISLLAQAKAACGGDLGKLGRVVKLTGFVNSTPDFTDQPRVINGASDFLVEALGDAGRHARSAVSAAALPLGVAVEIEGIFQLK